MKLFICILVLCNVNYLENLVCGGVLNSNKLFRLDIVHYNDFHDRFEETSISYPVCKSNDTKCVGGFARLYQEIKTLLQEKPKALLLNAGDVFQGTYWYTLLKWNITQKFINMLPNDAHAIGNHEFDDGIVGLAPYLAALKAPVVAANIDASNEPKLKGLFKPHVIVERDGKKIGIIGLITPDTAVTSNSEGVIFLDPIKSVEKEAKFLTEQGIDIIIVLSHCGLEVDKEMARSVGEHIDIIIGGHSHSLLWNALDAPSKEVISGPYPVIMGSHSKPEHKVLIVTASAFTKYLGNLTVYFDNAGELQDYSGQPVFLNRSIPEDPEIKTLLEPYKQELHIKVHEVVGYANENFVDKQCGAGECALGDLAADAYVNATLEMKLNKLPLVSFLMRNMIRGSIPKGDITRGSIINTLPFTNKVVSFKLLGKYLVEALEICMTTYWIKKPFNGPFMPHISGMKLTLNTTSAKVDSILVKVGDEFEPLDNDKEYQISTLKFLLQGGNGFKVLKEHGYDPIVIGNDAELLEKYIRKITPITPTLDNRLVIIE
ncbi:apyrase-like [Hyposmocoma kahamanoa]|uniref:apyrase-like n=1 Tax=Hyposmocoma kahamanoa TaxID=1477025 RepID=UPI000E6D9B38|nr:apyrase-like [Hyposmocoma kahamanoa]